MLSANKGKEKNVFITRMEHCGCRHSDFY